MITRRDDKNNVQQAAENISDKIHLSLKNKNLYGFACFYYPEEVSFTDDVSTRDVELANPNLQKTKIIIPKKDVVSLSIDKTKKVSSWKNYFISSCGVNIETMWLLSKRAGWNQLHSDLAEYVNLDPNGNFLAYVKTDDADIELGCGLVFPVNERLSWIGMILVHPELRRQGIANSIMKHCIRYAWLKPNDSIVGLDASPMGLNVYTSLGFKESFRIWRSVIPTNIKSQPDSFPLIEPIINFEPCEVYLNNKKVHDKTSLIKLLYKLNKERCFLYISGGKIKGLVINRAGRVKPHIGPLIADSSDVANSLLLKSLSYWKEIGYPEIFIDIPEYHFRVSSKYNVTKQSREDPIGCTFADSIKPVRELVRMYQLVRADEMERLLNEMTNQNSNNEEKDEWRKILTRAEKNSKETLEYMQVEKEVVLKHLYAIGGPEVS